MNRLISSIAVLAAATLAAPHAIAQQQRAPVTRGVTSTDLAGTVSELRQRNAQMGLDIARLEDEIGSLNGEIETLKFLLSQSRDESARMQEDDKRIGQALSDISSRNDRLERRLAELEEQIGSLSGQVTDDDMTAEAGEPVFLPGNVLKRSSAGAEPARRTPRHPEHQQRCPVRQRSRWRPVLSGLAWHASGQQSSR